MGKPIAQAELAQVINQVYQTKLRYNSISIEDYKAEPIGELGDFIGTVVAGIYEGIRAGAYEVSSDFDKATGRPHKEPQDMLLEMKEKNI